MINQKIFYLIRDRLGIKPLYYYEYKKSLIFSSEINAMVKLPLFRKEINLNAVSSYLSFRYPTEDDKTFIRELKEFLLEIYLKSILTGGIVLVIGKFSIFRK